MQVNFKDFKSGTDIRGVALGENATLTDEVVAAIIKAFMTWLSLKYDKPKLTVAVGNDSRLSAPRIAECVKRCILESGGNVIYTGLSSTPSMFILLKKSGWKADASVMITASHLPYDRNGLKFILPEGGLSGDELDEILALAENGAHTEGRGEYSERYYMDEYSAILVETVRKATGSKTPLAGKKIIVDAGNGVGGFFTDKVLTPLGADTEGSVLLEPDGTFPSHIPNPEDKRAIECVKRATVESGADLGIIFDTDVDRAAVVDNLGREINRNRLIALISALLLKDESGVIVTDSVTSDGLTQFITALGGKHLRYKRGYKNVIDKCRELNDDGIHSPLAIETSGHAAFKENYYLDDGAYLIVKLLILLASLEEGQSIFDIISELPEPAESDEIRLGLADKKAFKNDGRNIIKNITDRVNGLEGASLAGDNYEGVRINFKKGYGDGWLLLRQSLHDPELPVNMESNSPGGNKLMAETLYGLLKDDERVVCDNLEKFING